MRATVRRLLLDGWTVVGMDRTAQDPETDEPIGWVQGDVLDQDTVAQAMSKAGVLGEVRGLVTSTFHEDRGGLTALSHERASDVVRAQVESAWLWGTAVVRQCAEDPGAAIVHVSSVHASLAAVGSAPYAMAKAALNALTRAMAVEWGPRGIRCNAVLPGFVPVPRKKHRWSDSENLTAIGSQLPIGRAVSADEVANCVAFLVGSESAGVTGVCLPVDGGMLAVMPSWA